MDTISFAIQFWSKGEMSAKFLRHEGFLGAVGAYLKVPGLQIFDGSASASEVGRGRSGGRERCSHQDAGWQPAGRPSCQIAELVP